MEKKNRKAILFFVVPLLSSGALLLGAMKVVSHPVVSSGKEGEKRSTQQTEKLNAAAAAKKYSANKRVVVSNGREIAEADLQNAQPNQKGLSDGPMTNEKNEPSKKGDAPLLDKGKNESQMKPEGDSLDKTIKAPLQEKGADLKKTNDTKEQASPSESDKPEAPNPDTITKPSPPAIPLCPSSEKVGQDNALAPIILVINIQSDSQSTQKSYEVKLANEKSEVNPIIIPITLQLNSQKEDAKVAIQSVEKK